MLHENLMILILMGLYMSMKSTTRASGTRGPHNAEEDSSTESMQSRMKSRTTKWHGNIWTARKQDRDFSP